MVSLFVIENNVARPEPECLLISPFKEIWDRDSTLDKRKAIADFSFIEFMTSLRQSNPFKDYEGKERREKVIEEVQLDKNWKPDELVEKGIERIEEFQNKCFSFRFLKSCKTAAEKIIHHNNTVDLNERTKSGGIIFKADDLVKTIEKAKQTLNGLNSLEKDVRADLLEMSKTKANREISDFNREESFD